MTTWILLRGLTRETRHWHAFPQLLARDQPDVRVIPLELPGNGALNGLTSPASIEGMASHCRREMTRLGVLPPYRVLAMSMGAMVATAWAGSYPEEVEACVLINTSFGAFSPVHQRFRPRAWQALFRYLFTRSMAQREGLIFDLTSRTVDPRPAVIAEWTAIRRCRPVSAWNALRQLVAAARYRAPARAPVPTLVLASAGDRLVNPCCSMEIARRWKCACRIHPTAGHDLPLDDGVWVVRQVDEWLA